MDDEKGSTSSSAPTTTVTTSFVKSGDRQRFTVELRSDETTIVSWKKLIKDANNRLGRNTATQVNGVGPVVAPASAVAAGSGGGLVMEDNDIVNKTSIAHPGLESRIAPAQPADNELKDEPPSHRFSAVIEKIERLYMGKDSSDEEDLDDIPDDDQYDTEDSFIDDAELDEYFQVDNSATKHNGFFVNRGKLERMNEPPPVPSQQIKKRRRKDVPKAPGEGDDSHIPIKQAKVGKSASGKSTAFSGKNSSDQVQSSSLRSQHYEDGKYQNQVKKKPADTRISLDSSVSLKVSNGDVSAFPSGMVDTERQNIGVQSKIFGNKLRDASGSSDALHQKHHDKSAISQSRSPSARQLDELAQPIRHREKSGSRDLHETNFVEGRHPMQATKFPNMLRKDGSSVRPKGSLLERAIRELEKMVAESRPPAMDAQDADAASQAVKRRLPREVKQKLAKVARLAQASHGKISKELISRLMSILGHLMQLRTLKRNLKIMVNSGLSAKQEKDDRFHQIKKEVSDMINIRALPKVLEQAGTSDDFQEFASEEKGAIKKKLNMDSALEDKICDLYDLYVDGLEEDSGPQIRKLYTELADLWPNRSMDNHGIKRAICRAKERKRMFYFQNKDQEKIRRKKLMAPKVEENAQAEANAVAMAQQMRERSATESGGHTLTSSSRSAPTTSAAAVRAPSPSVNAPSSERIKQDKLKMSFNNAMDDIRPANVQQPKKKVKRMPETEFGDSHSRPDRLLPEQGDERQKSQKPAPGVPQKSSQQSVPPPTVEQLKLG